MNYPTVRAIVFPNFWLEIVPMCLQYRTPTKFLQFDEPTPDDTLINPRIAQMESPSNQLQQKDVHMKKPHELSKYRIQLFI